MPDQRKRSFEDDEHMNVEEGRASVKKARTAEEDTMRTDNDVAIVIDVDELATGTFVSDAKSSDDLKAIKLEEVKGKVRAGSPSTENEETIQCKQRKELESELEILEDKHTKLQESLAKSEKLVARLVEKKKFLSEAVALSRKTCAISQTKRNSLEEEVSRLKQDADNLTSELDQSKQQNAHLCEEILKLREELRQATLQTSSSDSGQKTGRGGERSPVMFAEHTEPKKLHRSTQPQHLASPTDTVTDVQDQTLNIRATNTETLEVTYPAARIVSDLWSYTPPTSGSEVITSIELAMSGLNFLKKRVFEYENTISKLTSDLEALNAMKTEQDTQSKQLSIERDKAVEEAASSHQQYAALRQTLINLGNG
ncbi:hypothetical protein SERLA73DRAFT_186073 [Serpula lacrymans var. lacrymans S7.3]|uniref:Uncharacterized protein n=2 Tax=Serpula lacrymans var. lacrymans TaxID=341189 RepID=F8Q6X0_SERL3|nr:uncharacterized protein SERLADRAFT_474934 [Serpula lacrymans var. lacrymans S7.9]EGN96358.1 hypothetical protein SERLA73DRAFT_186073 [Serpula lacrymans var. lacrymans S7.3]EGO21896.1 hypothetical protein SERLADRAFT_474934 [Serpula lacrymans var. lacrymans S7.9]